MKCLNDVNYKGCIGKVCKSKLSGDFKILKYNNGKNVEIQFLKTGYEMVARLDHIKSGKVKDPYSQSVFGIGVLGNKYPSSEGSRNTKEYMLWYSMLTRCYSDTYKNRHPTYEYCTVSENFLRYEYFYEWCQKQIGFNVNGFDLDKDLLVKGNKVYSEDSCVFIPREINLVLTKCTASRGRHIIGVHWHNASKAFVAKVNKNKGKQEWLGVFKTEMEAFSNYKKAKESYLKELASKFKSQIDPRAYNALMNYEVGIDD